MERACKNEKDAAKQLSFKSKAIEFYRLAALAGSSSGMNRFNVLTGGN
jgi:hypothetical protein